MGSIGTRTLALAALAGGVLALALPVRAQTNLCSLLPQADVSSVVGTPVKLADSKIETSTSPTGTLRTQVCNYGPPGGIGSGPANVRVTISQADSTSVAAQLFKSQAETLLPMVAGKSEPLSGVGDEARSFHVPGSIYMRKKNVTVDIHVGLVDLNLDKEVAMCKELALKLAARLP
ncbi:MAG TPA: hypothetical protein VGY48_00530 [Vicinamibacterales bacterium]|jgi:hypothetical protein|nr:hypothetical protein [Vicinamibacterales bacterium]